MIFSSWKKKITNPNDNKNNSQLVAKEQINLKNDGNKTSDKNSSPSLIGKEIKIDLLHTDNIILLRRVIQFFNELFYRRIDGAIGTIATPIKMQCFQIYSFSKAICVVDVDHFSLDVEGAEYKIMNLM